MELCDVVSKACQLVSVAAELAAMEKRLLKVQTLHTLTPLSRLPEVASAGIFYADQLSSIDTGLHCSCGDLVESVSSFYPSLEAWLEIRESVRALIAARLGRHALTATLDVTRSAGRPTHGCKMHIHAVGVGN